MRPHCSSRAMSGSLETVAGNGANDAGALRDGGKRTNFAPLLAKTLEQSGDGGCAGGLDKNAFVRGEPALRFEDFRIGNNINGPMRIADRTAVLRQNIFVKPASAASAAGKCLGKERCAVPFLAEHLSRPAIDAALAGSTKMPSRRARNRCASRISASVTISMAPCESRMAAVASFQLAGLPMRMALATVSGFGTTLL